MIINLPTKSIGGLGPNYPSSVVMILGGINNRRKRKIEKIFEISKMI